MPSPSSWGHNQLLMSLLEGTSCIADFLGCFWRPCELPCQHNLSGFPSHSVGTGRSALYDEVMTHTLTRGPHPDTLQRIMKACHLLLRCSCWCVASTELGLMHVRGVWTTRLSCSSRLTNVPTSVPSRRGSCDRSATERRGQGMITEWRPCWTWALQECWRAYCAVSIAQVTGRSASSTWHRYTTTQWGHQSYRLLSRDHMQAHRIGR